MFTGLIEELGHVSSIQKNADGARLTIVCKKVLADVHVGDSIATNGVCLTVCAYHADGFSADVMQETLNRSALGGLSSGAVVNLERAMAVGSRFGGHIVSGHIDGVGKIRAIRKEGIATWYHIQAERKLLRYVVEKGSIAIDGISLTVAEVGSDSFAVSIIPHTASETTLSLKKVGAAVNLETDVVGKYVESLLAPQQSISQSFLAEHGFGGGRR